MYLASLYWASHQVRQTGALAHAPHAAAHVQGICTASISPQVDNDSRHVEMKHMHVEYDKCAIQTSGRTPWKP